MLRRLGDSTIARIGIFGSCLGLVTASIQCSGEASGTNPNGACTKDQNGVNGGHDTVFLTVSDTAFAVGAPNSGQPNITIENLSTVTLTLNNVGTKPHDLVVSCRSTPNAGGSPLPSCFPPEAGIPPVAAGQSATTMFVAPCLEGAYPFISDLPGDTETSADGGTVGLVGEFLLM